MVFTEQIMVILAGTEEYGDISNVKEVYIYNKTSILLKNSGEVLTWGDTSNLANTFSIKDTLVNGTKIIINEGGAAALLKKMVQLLYGEIQQKVVHLQIRFL